MNVQDDIHSDNRHSIVTITYKIEIYIQSHIKRWKHKAFVRANKDTDIFFQR